MQTANHSRFGKFLLRHPPIEKALLRFSRFVTILGIKILEAGETLEPGLSTSPEPEQIRAVIAKRNLAVVKQGPRKPRAPLAVVVTCTTHTVNVSRILLGDFRGYVDYIRNKGAMLWDTALEATLLAIRAHNVKLVVLLTPTDSNTQDHAILPPRRLAEARDAKLQQLLQNPMVLERIDSGELMVVHCDVDPKTHRIRELSRYPRNSSCESTPIELAPGIVRLAMRPIARISHDLAMALWDFAQNFDVVRAAAFPVGRFIANKGLKLMDQCPSFEPGQNVDTPQALWNVMLARNARVIGRERMRLHPPIGLVIACMDSRIDASRILGDLRSLFQQVRNPGAVLSVSVGLAISEAKRMGARIIILMSHTDCAMEATAKSVDRGRYPILSVRVDNRDRDFEELRFHPSVREAVMSGQLILVHYLLNTATWQLTEKYVINKETYGEE